MNLTIYYSQKFPKISLFAFKYPKLIAFTLAVKLSFVFLFFFFYEPETVTCILQCVLQIDSAVSGKHMQDTPSIFALLENYYSGDYLMLH